MESRNIVQTLYMVAAITPMGLSEGCDPENADIPGHAFVECQDAQARIHEVILDLLVVANEGEIIAEPYSSDGGQYYSYHFGDSQGGKAICKQFGDGFHGPVSLICCDSHGDQDGCVTISDQGGSVSYGLWGGTDHRVKAFLAIRDGKVGSFALGAEGLTSVECPNISPDELQAWIHERYSQLSGAFWRID